MGAIIQHRLFIMQMHSDADKYTLVRGHYKNDEQEMMKALSMTSPSRIQVVILGDVSTECTPAIEQFSPLLEVMFVFTPAKPCLNDWTREKI